MSQPAIKLTYISIDPGVTTGVCVAKVIFKDNLVKDINIIESSEISWKRRFQRLEFFLDYFKYDYCVCEDFRLYRTKSRSQVNSRFPSSQLIGTIEYMCWSRNIPIVFQLAADRKRVKVDTKYHSLLGGLTSKGNPKSQHRWDSFQHLRYFAVKKAKGIWQLHLNEISP